MPDLDTAKAPLLAALHGARNHILGAFEGASDAELRRPVLPSGWSCLGLIQHLALDVERFWFRAAVAGEKVELKTGDEAWRVAPDVPADEIFELYRTEAALADEIIAATPLDATPLWWPDEMRPGFAARPLLRVMLHVITETATHAGHLDAARELLDGKTWLVLT